MLRGIAKRLVHDDDGVALLTVIGVILVMSILAVMSYSLASNALASTEANQSELSAFQVANAGIDTVYADLTADSDAAVARYASGATRTLTVGDGTCDVTLESLSGIEYQCTSIGYADDGTSETVKVRFYYMNLWEMFIAAGDDEDSVGGGAINGNASVDGPFYVRGDLPITGSTDFIRGPLFVTGDISMGGSSKIGTVAVPIDVFVGGTYPTNNSNLHAKRISNSVPDITAPALDDSFMDAALSRAKLESMDNLQGTPEFAPSGNVEVTSGNAATYPTARSGSWTRPKATGASTFYKYIGSDSRRSAIGEGTTDLTIGGTGSWGSWENDGHGYTTGEWDDFAFDDVNNILYVEGTVFIDGDLTIDEDVKYVGNGAIIVNGDVTVDGYLVPRNYEMSEGEVLGLICAGDMYVSGDGNWGSYNVVAALYAKDSLNFTKANTSVKGSIISPQINFPSANFHLVSDPNLPTFLPWSLPGRDTPILIIGAWSRE